MSNKKLIPCRVCGKLFKPCGYCQSHSDTFMWRNFACSIECAEKYINDTIKYRESMKAKVVDKENINTEEFSNNKKPISKKKTETKNVIIKSRVITSENN